jgi:hypothetical protein
MAVDKRHKRALLEVIVKRETMLPEERVREDIKTKIWFNHFMARFLAQPFVPQRRAMMYVN